MKSHVNASPQRSCFATRSCARFSPTSVMPPSASAPSSSTGTYLIAAQISTSSGSRAGVGDARRARARGSPRSRAGSRPVNSRRHDRHTIPPWRPVTPSSRRCEKNTSGSQYVQRPTSWMCATPPARSLRLGDRLQVEHAARRRRRPGRRTRRAPRARPRSGTGRCPGRSRRDRLRRRTAPERARRSRPASPRQPQCSIATRDGDTSATGRQSATSTSSATPSGRGHVPVDLLQLGARRRVAAVDRAAPSHSSRSTPCTCQPIATWLGATARAPTPAARGSRPRASWSSSVRMPRLSDSYGPSLTPPVARGEDDLAARQRDADHRATSERVAQLVVAPVDLAVELGPQRLRQRAAERGPGLDARGDQVVAGDVQPHEPQPRRPLEDRLGRHAQRQGERQRLGRLVVQQRVDRRRRQLDRARAPPPARARRAPRAPPARAGRASRPSCSSHGTSVVGRAQHERGEHGQHAVGADLGGAERRRSPPASRRARAPGRAALSIPSSRSRSIAAGASTSASRSSSSSRIRCPDTVRSAPIRTASRASRSVSGSIRKPSRVS